MNKTSTVKAKNQINKNSLHFKLASWSLKNPRLFWGASGGVVALTLLVVIGGTWMLANGQGHRPVPTFNSTKGQIVQEEKSEWKLISKVAVDETRECRTYIKNNDVQMTSCFDKDARGEWQWVTSY